MYGNLPTGPMRQRVSQVTYPVSLDRPTNRDETVPGSGRQYTENATVEDLYLYAANSSEAIIDVGETERGSMQGIALSEADVQVGDRLDYNGRRYEVEEPIEDLPSESSSAIIRFPLSRVHDPDTF